MTRNFLFIFCFNLLCLISFAQDVDNDKRDQKIQSLEIAFISRKLNLTPEEAQRFWPIFNQYKQDIRQSAKTLKSQADIDVLEQEQKLIDIRKKYKNQFSDAVGKERMNDFFRAEHEFRGVLLNRIKNRPVKNGKSVLEREKRFRN